MTPSDLLSRPGWLASWGDRRRHPLADRLRAFERPARTAAQSAAAALVAFGLFKLAGLPQASWAVISALFVIQPNVGGTINTALGRIVGTAAGTAVGLACALALGGSGWAIALGLLLATASLGFVTGLHPGLRYSLVPAAFILLAPGGETLEKAWHGAAAIGIGAVIGALTGLLVFPQAAHRGLERHLGAALGRCGDLLDQIIGSLLSQTHCEEVSAAADAIDDELWAAGGLAAQSRYPSRMRRHPTHPRPRRLLRAVETLWHSLLLLARPDHAPLPPAVRRDLAPALSSFAAAAGTHLRRLGDALENDAPAPADPTGPCVRALNEALRRWQQEGTLRSLDEQETRRIFTLAFAVQELNRDFGALAGLFSEGGERRG